MVMLFRSDNTSKFQQLVEYLGLKIVLPCPLPLHYIWKQHVNPKQKCIVVKCLTQMYILPSKICHDWYDNIFEAISHIMS